MDSIKLANTLSPGGHVPFKTIEHGKVKWYACGPTVYDQSHCESPISAGASSEARKLQALVPSQHALSGDDTRCAMLRELVSCGMID